MKYGLTKALLKRVLISVIVLFLLISFIFILLRISPGDPSQKFVSPELSPELANHVKDNFNLNDSIFEQYKSFLVNLSQGDFGISYNYRTPVLNVIERHLPITLVLAVLSLIVQLGFGIPLALISVKNIGSKKDKFINKLSLFFYAIPSFALGVLLIFLFSEKISLFPSAGIKTLGSDDWSFWDKLWDYIVHLILPVITLSVSGIAIFYRYMRDNLEDIYNSNFVTNLRSYGMNERKITRKHILPNAIGPVISVAGVELGFLLSGALITEVIFSLPGMGRLAINAIQDRDYPLVIGCTIVAGVLVILSNLLADIIRAKLDKRIVKEII